MLIDSHHRDSNTSAPYSASSHPNGTVMDSLTCHRSSFTSVFRQLDSTGRLLTFDDVEDDSDRDLSSRLSRCDVSRPFDKILWFHRWQKNLRSDSTRVLGFSVSAANIGQLLRLSNIYASCLAIRRSAGASDPVNQEALDVCPKGCPSGLLL